MQKKSNILQHCFRILLTMAAYGYLLYVLLTYKDYPLLLEHFQNAGPLEWGALVLCIVLFPFNIFLEAWKWQYLLKDIEPISLREAQAQVYFGFLGAFVTPQRLGDYPTRATRLSNSHKWLPAVALGFVGSMALTIINILGGIFPCLYLGNDVFANFQSKYIWISAIFIITFCIAILFFLPAFARWLSLKFSWGQMMQTLLDVIGKFPVNRFPVIVLRSFCRYIIFCIQLALVLYFCGATGVFWQVLFIGIPFYYMLVTLLPSIPAADMAIRGSVATFSIGIFVDQSATIAIAVILLWVINTIFPMLCGTFVKKKS